ncbi:hypothetical protein T11_8015 [Trichinella zimbabwensis]|uniref:Uncharacterized protein n=1 Tax=Trichinella zimbabwensis TaxID=268475 RepID=A0A0V1GH91_9BILA|nr:hypothetical protein T11_8015 [Trichinella zimbabwensis]
MLPTVVLVTQFMRLISSSVEQQASRIIAAAVHLLYKGCFIGKDGDDDIIPEDLLNSMLFNLNHSLLMSGTPVI